MVVSFIVAIIISMVVFVISNDFGITWDEPIYFGKANAYMEWILSPSMRAINKTFQVSDYDIHPPLRKLAAGLTHELFTNRLKILDNTRGYRVSSLLFVIPFVFVYTYIAIGQLGLLPGILVPFMYSFMPHVLFLTPLVTMDYAIAALWFMTVVMIMKGVKHLGWLVFSGLLIGSVLLTKLHGFLLLVPVGVYWIVYYRHKKFQAQIDRPPWKELRKLFLVFGISFAVYFVGWPWLWTAPFTHIGEYFRLQLVHGSVPVYVFGHMYERVGWWYALLMFLTTTPVFVLILFLIGAIFAIRKGRTWDRIMLANAIYPIAFFSLPWVYRYDWIRLFLMSFPFVCLLAGRGISVIIGSLRSSLRVSALCIIFVFWVATVYHSVIRIHPWESAYYNELVGGISGASRLGFETEFWGNAYGGVLSWMNEHKKDMMCVTPTTHPFYYYQAMGQLEPGVVFNAGRDVCHFAVVLMRQGLFIQAPFVARVVATQHPVYTVSIDGVSLVNVYNIQK